MNAAAVLWCKKTTAVSDRVLLANSGSLAALIQGLVDKWASIEGACRHLLNDVDDQREFVGFAPLAEVIFAWSKVVKYEPRFKEGNWVSRIDRLEEGKWVTEKRHGLYKVIVANRHSLECVQFGWKYGSLIKHSIVSIQVSDAVKVCVTDNQNGHMPAIVVDKMSLIDKEHITAIWHKDFVNGS